MKRILHLLLVAVLVGAAGGGLWLWHERRVREASDRLVLYGNVDIRQAALAFNGSDRIASLLVDEGDRITAGQLLARLETRRFELAVARAEAQVDSRRQTVARLVAGTRPEEIRKVRADVAAAEAILDDTEKTFRRVSALVPRKAASVQDLDDAKAAVESGRASLKAAKAVLDLAIAGPRVEDIAAAKALLAADEADLALARRNLEDAFLYAPSDGIVQERILEVGEMASPRQPVFTVALIDPLWVRAYVPEPDLGKLREGMPALVSTDSFPEKRYEGWVGYISPTAEFTPKPVETTEVRTRLVYQVRVFVRNPAGELRLGMPATVTVPLDPGRGEKGAPSPGGPAAGSNG